MEHDSTTQSELDVEDLSSQIFDLWVQPELARRELQLETSDIRKVLVEMPPNGAPVVLLNDEVELVGEVRATRDITAGEEVTEADYDEVIALWPASIDEDSGWICYATIGGSRVVAFDFRYNRRRARALLETAEQFLAAARSNGESLPNPCIDNAYSAAELSVQATMLTTTFESRGHRERLEWLRQWVEHRNAPESHHHMLANLRDQRARARYEGNLKLKPGRIPRILTEVQEMVGRAHALVGEPRVVPPARS